MLSNHLTYAERRVPPICLALAAGGRSRLHSTCRRPLTAQEGASILASRPPAPTIWPAPRRAVLILLAGAGDLPEMRSGAPWSGAIARLMPRPRRRLAFEVRPGLATRGDSRLQHCPSGKGDESVAVLVVSLLISSGSPGEDCHTEPSRPVRRTASGSHSSCPDRVWVRGLPERRNWAVRGGLSAALTRPQALPERSLQPAVRQG